MSNNSPADTNVKIDITANADGMAPGVDKAKGQLDQLTNSTSEFEKKQRTAVDTSEKMSQVTGRTTQQFATLGREIVRGDTARIPGTLAGIAMGFGPIGMGVAAVAAAVAAGVWAWNQWGDSAEEAAKKALDELKKVEEIAAKSKHKNAQEQIRDKELLLESIKGEIASIEYLRELNSKKLAEDRISRKEWQAEEERLTRMRGMRGTQYQNESRNLEDLQKPSEDKASKHQEEIDRTIEREQSKYDKLHQMAVMADATDSERISWKLAFDLQSMEKEHNAAKLIYGKNSTMDQAYQDARLERIAMADGEAERLAAAKEEKEEKLRQTKMRSEMSVANFSKLLRQGDFEGAMSMAERMTAGLATKSRAAFEVNKAASLAKATVSGYDMIMKAAEDGSTWGGYWGGIAEGALATAYVLANLEAINSTQFGGGGGVSAPSGGGGVPSQATSPGVPVTQTQPQSQTIEVNIYNTGNVLSNDYIEGTIIPQIRDSITNNDVTIIDPRSRQAQMLGAA